MRFSTPPASAASTSSSTACDPGCRRSGAGRWSAVGTDRLDDRCEQFGVGPAVLRWARALPLDETVARVLAEQVRVGYRLAVVLDVGAVAHDNEIEARDHV